MESYALTIQKYTDRHIRRARLHGTVYLPSGLTANTLRNIQHGIHNVGSAQPRYANNAEKRGANVNAKMKN
eukprot:12146115-Karenia_brevis.AAC.1